MIERKKRRKKNKKKTEKMKKKKKMKRKKKKKKKKRKKKTACESYESCREHCKRWASVYGAVLCGWSPLDAKT